MSSISTQETVILALVCVLVGVNVALGCHAMWKRRGQLGDKLWVRCHGCRSWWRKLRMRKVKEDDDEVAAFVAKYVTDKVNKGMRTTWAANGYITVLSVMIIGLRIITRLETWMTIGQIGAAIGFCVCTTITCLIGRYPSAAFCYAVTMIVMCSLIATSHPTPETIWYLDGSIAVFRLVLGWQYHGWRSVTTWNIAYLCSALYVFGQCTVSEQEQSWFLLGQLWYILAVFCVAAHANRTMTAEARGVAERENLREESSAFRDMLELVCDVVAPLDEGLRLAEETSRLSAMVTFRQKASVKGMRIQDFMPDEGDKIAFESCMNALSENDTGATTSRVLHSKLRDGLGNTLSVELFCVLTRSLFGKGYLLGIREFSDYAPAPMAAGSRSQRRTRSQAGSSDGGSPHSSGRPSNQLASESGSDTESVHSSDHKDKVATRLSPTSDTGVQLALVRVMARLEVRSRASCCPYHQRLRHITKAVGSLKSVECLPSFETSDKLQCKTCGFLNPDSLGGDVEATDGHVTATCFACQNPIERRSPLSL